MDNEPHISIVDALIVDSLSRIKLIWVGYFLYDISIRIKAWICNHNYLTQLVGDKMTTIFQTTFSNGFSWMKMCEFWLKCYWSLFLGGPIYNIPALFQMMAWGRPGDKPLSEPMIALFTDAYMCHRPQWVKKLGCIDSSVPWLQQQFS